MEGTNANDEDPVLYECLKEVIMNETKALSETFSTQFIQTLIASSRARHTRIHIFHDTTGYFFKGYPMGNLIKILARVLEIWAREGYFCVNFCALQGISTDATLDHIREFAIYTESVRLLYDSSQEQRGQALALELLLRLGPRGVLTCLGVRKTTGSIDLYCLPKKRDLINAFNMTYSKEESKECNLSVGARALCKHNQRSSEGFWGVIQGTERKRNSMAQQLLYQFLNEATWINIHSLPKEKHILEIRVAKGYGARWFLQNGVGFRGLVEPQVSGGHEVKWRHQCFSYIRNQCLLDIDLIYHVG